MDKEDIELKREQAESHVEDEHLKHEEELDSKEEVEQHREEEWDQRESREIRRVLVRVVEREGLFLAAVVVPAVHVRWTG